MFQLLKMFKNGAAYVKVCKLMSQLFFPPQLPTALCREEGQDASKRVGCSADFPFFFFSIIAFTVCQVLGSSLFASNISININLVQIECSAAQPQFV